MFPALSLPLKINILVGMPLCRNLFFNNLVLPESTYEQLKNLIFNSRSLMIISHANRTNWINTTFNSNKILKKTIISQPESETEKNEEKEVKINTKATKRKMDFIVPVLTPKRINELSTIVGISIGIFNISWMKISVPSLNVLDWNAKVLPEDFTTKKDEHSILKLAYDVKRNLPTADLYVMETFSIKGRELCQRLNYLHLSSMITVLLNGVDTDINDQGKVVFQKQFVLNNLHDLRVGYERISSKHKVEDFLYRRMEKKEPSATASDVFSSVDIQPKLLASFKESNMERKEDLSLVFLLTLTFIDVNILKNEIALKKIWDKKSAKLKI